MTPEEAIDALALAVGKFRVMPNDAGDGINVRYTGSDPEEEGRIAQALIVLAQATASTLGADLEVLSLRTDDVHVHDNDAQNEGGME